MSAYFRSLLLEQYCTAVMENGVDGQVLLKLIGMDALGEIGVQSRLHAAKIKTKLPTSSQVAKPAYTKVRVLGKGSFGTTYLAHHEAKGHVALKTVEVQSSNEAQKAVREYTKMQELRHAALVTGLDCFVEAMELGQYRVNIVMEFCDGGDLKGYIDSRRPLSEPAVCAMLVPLVQALQFLHGRGKIHRDVKPSNVLLCTDGRLKLGDLGLMRGSDSRSTSRGAAGSLFYMAPEAFLPDPTAALDIWALGVTAVEMAAEAELPGDIVRTQDQVFSLSRAPSNCVAVFAISRFGCPF